MKTNNTFLRFIDPNTKETVLVSIADILSSGCPLISEGEDEGNDMELDTFYLLNENGAVIKTD